MRIGIFTHSLIEGGLTGQGTYLRELISGLNSKNDIALTLLYYRKSEVTDFKDLETIKLPNINFPKFLPMIFAPFFTRKYKFDLLHFPSDGISPYINSHDNIVYTCHGVAPFVLSRDMYKRMNPVVKRTLTKKHHVIKKIITPSEFAKIDISNVFNIPSEKITVIYHGINKEFQQPVDQYQSGQFLSENGLKPPYILHVSNYQPMKNIKRIIRVFSNLIQDHAQYTLVLAGSKGWKFDESTTLISELGIAQKVNHLGVLNSSALKILYANAQLFVFPSLWESFGFPAFEAMACGTPTIISNTNSLTEIAGESGLKVDPNSIDEITNGMKKIITDKDFQKKLSESGKARSKELRWTTTIEKHYQLFHEIVHG